MPRNAVFLDRDGVINHDPGGWWVTRIEDLYLLPDVPDALRRLRAGGYACVVVTNQSAVDRGIFPAEHLERMHAWLAERLAHEGAPVDGIYYCPHRSAAECDCRKPRPGMLLRAAQELDLALSPESYMVGDRETDIEAGQAAGVRTILLYGPGTASARASQETKADHIARGLPAAAELILGETAVRRTEG